MTRDAVVRWLEEDAPWGDVTSEVLVPEDVDFDTVFRARQSGVMAGSTVLREVFAAVDARCQLKSVYPDGKRFDAGDDLALVSGPARSILRAERVALNLLQRLCGIATSTAAYVDEVAGTKARIVDTRKTAPGLRQLEKMAVIAGGGYNHRFSLSDAVLVKDNHLSAIGGIGNLCELRSRLPHVTHIEIEVDSLDDIPAALKVGADSILCDNFSLVDLRKAVELIDGRALVDASGGVNLATVRAVAQTGVDLIAVGAITHSAPAIDIGLDARISAE